MSWWPFEGDGTSCDWCAVAIEAREKAAPAPVFLLASLNPKFMVREIASYIRVANW